MKTVLLTGATGTLGLRLIDELFTQNYRIIALTRAGSEHKLKSKQALIHEIRCADVTDISTFKNLFLEIDIVVSTLGITRQKDGKTYEEIDYQANLNLMQQAQNEGVQKFGYVSVLGVDQALDVPVLNAKFKFENALRNSNLDWVIYRPSGFFTDLVEIFSMARAGRVYLFGDGETRFAPIDPSDLAEFVVNNLEKSKIILPVGGPKTLSGNEIAQMCFKLLQMPEKITHIPMWLTRIGWTLVRPFSFSLYSLIKFFAVSSNLTLECEAYGERRLVDFLKSHNKSNPAG